MHSCSILALKARGIGAGDEVITTPLTFCATANTIIHTGAAPIFVDIDPATLNLDAKKLEAAITPHTKAVVPVHFAGQSCDMDQILAIAKSMICSCWRMPLMPFIRPITINRLDQLVMRPLLASMQRKT